MLRLVSGYFDEIYAVAGAPSISPETLPKGNELHVLYTVRSERQLCARLQTDLLFRWVVDMLLDEAVFDAPTFSKNQARLLGHEVADLFLYEVVEVARRSGWVSNDHFSVDVALIKAWALLKSYKPKGTDQGSGSGRSWADFKGEKTVIPCTSPRPVPRRNLCAKTLERKRLCASQVMATMENRKRIVRAI